MIDDKKLNVLRGFMRWRWTGSTPDNQDTAFERDYDTVEQGSAQRITNPGHWTIWRNSEGFVSVRRYDREGDSE